MKKKFLENSKVFIQFFSLKKTKIGMIKLCFLFPNSFFLLGKKIKTEKIYFYSTFESTNFFYSLTSLDFFIKEKNLCGFQTIFSFFKKEDAPDSSNEKLTFIDFFYFNEN